MHCIVAASEGEQRAKYESLANVLGHIVFLLDFWGCTSNEFVVRFAVEERLLFCDTFIGNYSATDENAV